MGELVLCTLTLECIWLQLLSSFELLTNAGALRLSIVVEVIVIILSHARRTLNIFRQFLTDSIAVAQWLPEHHITGLLR